MTDADATSQTMSVSSASVCCSEKARGWQRHDGTLHCGAYVSQRSDQQEFLSISCRADQRHMAWYGTLYSFPFSGESDCIARRSTGPPGALLKS